MKSFLDRLLILIAFFLVLQSSAWAAPERKAKDAPKAEKSESAEAGKSPKAEASQKGAAAKATETPEQADSKSQKKSHETAQPADDAEPSSASPTASSSARKPAPVKDSATAGSGEKEPDESDDALDPSDGPDEDAEADEAIESEATAKPSATTTPTPIATPTPKPEPKVELTKFGLILPLSGGSASWGKNMRNAAVLAFEDLEPETKKKMSIVFEDDQLKGPLAVSAFKKLTEVDKVRGVVVFGEQSVIPVAPLAEKKEVPIFAITSNKEAVKGQLFTFRHWLDSSEQVKSLVPYLLDKDIRNVSIVVVKHDAMLDYVTKFSVAAAQAGIEILSKVEVGPQDTDFKVITAKIKEEQPDGLLLVLLPPQLSIFTKKLRDLGVGAPLFGFANTETASEVKAAAGAMDGMVYSAPRLSKDFVKRFQDRFDDFPELATANVYDIVKIFGAAVKSGATDPRSVANYIRRVKDFQGVMGTYSIGEDNDFLLKSELKRIKRGSFRPIDEQ